MHTSYTAMNDSNNNTTLIIVDCDEGKMSIRSDDVSVSTKSMDVDPSKKDTRSEDDNEGPRSESIEPATIRDFFELHLHPLVSRSKKNGQTPIMVACLSGCLSAVMKIAIGTHVDVNKRDSEGNTALMLAAQAGHSDIIRFLLWSYDTIAIDAENNFGLTALMKTALRGHSLCARILILAGADVAKRDHGRRYSAYDWAVLCGFKRTAQIIKAMGTAGPPQIHIRISQSCQKNTMLTMARNIYNAMTKRLSKLCCRREEWIDNVGSLYYLVQSTAPPGITTWPFSWHKLDRISLPDESKDEVTNEVTNFDVESGEREELHRTSISYSAKDCPEITLTNSSPVANRKSLDHCRNHHADKNLLVVPPRRHKNNKK